jgi:hypothetical protein
VFIKKLCAYCGDKNINISRDSDESAPLTILAELKLLLPLNNSMQIRGTIRIFIYNITANTPLYSGL